MLKSNEKYKLRERERERVNMIQLDVHMKSNDAENH